MMSPQDPEPTALVRAVLLDGFSRIENGVREVVDGLGAEDLTWVPEAATNPIGWLLWHLCRQQDVQLAALADEQEVWTEGWGDRFDLPYERDAMGYRQGPEEVAAFRVTDPSLLTGYAEAVHSLSVRVVEALAVDDYDKVIDHSWNPPVTIGVRVYSVLEDSAKHLGQAEYLKGMIERR